MSRLLERVRGGEEIVIAKAGKPIARLVAVKRPGPRKPGLAEGKVTAAFFEQLPMSELGVWLKYISSRLGPRDLTRRYPRA